MKKGEEVKEMISVKPGPNGRPKVSINYSSLSVIQTCLRKAKYSLHDGLRKVGGSDALVFGTAIHKALEVWYCSDVIDRKLPKNLTEEARLIVAGNGRIDVSSHPAYQAIAAFAEEAQPISGLPDSDKRCLDNGAKILAEYFRRYSDDGLSIVRNSAGEPYVEKMVRFELESYGDYDLEFFGTIDAILENKATGMICVADHKTTSALGSQFFNRLKPNHQYTGYIMGANKVLGLDTNIFMINGIQVAKTKQQYARQFTERSEEDFKEFTDAVNHNVRMYLNAMQTDCWPQSAPDPCTNWGGCEYIKVCEVPKQLKGSILKALWEEKCQ